MDQLVQFIHDHIFFSTLSTGLLGSFCGVSAYKFFASSAREAVDEYRAAQNSTCDFTRPEPQEPQQSTKPPINNIHVGKHTGFAPISYARTALNSENFQNYGLCPRKLNVLIKSFRSATTERQKNLLALRLSLKVGQVEFGHMVNLSASKVSNLERNPHQWDNFYVNLFSKRFDLPKQLFSMHTGQKSEMPLEQPEQLVYT